MNKLHNQISLIDWLPSIENVSMGLPSNRLFLIDPYQSFCKGQWQRASENLDVLNDIYGQVFEQTVIKGKQLVCYWPEFSFSPSESFDLAKVQKEFEVEITFFKKNYTPIDGRLSYEELLDWKEFILTLIQSIAEDIQLNQDLEEVMTLSSQKNQIRIFSTHQSGATSYCYFLGKKGDFDREEQLPELEFFNSFEDLLSRVAMDLHLYDCVSDFHDRKYEKLFYKYLLKNKYSYNFIPFWKRSLNYN